MATEQQATHAQVLAETRSAAANMQPQTVPVNMWEAPEALVLVAPAPAVMASDVNIELRDGVLRFWADLRSAGPRAYLVHEWDYGGYEREIELPPGFGRGLEATLANGQLAIRVLRGEPSADLRAKPSA